MLNITHWEVNIDKLCVIIKNWSNQDIFSQEELSPMMKIISIWVLEEHGTNNR